MLTNDELNHDNQQPEVISSESPVKSQGDIEGMAMFFAGLFLLPILIIALPVIIIVGVLSEKESQDTNEQHPDTTPSIEDVHHVNKMLHDEITPSFDAE